MVIRSPSGGFVYLTPEAAMANLQALQRRESCQTVETVNQRSFWL
jgi:hypothetical protein